LIGRWINRDPIEEKGGWNLYVMCKNNCIDKRDYFGLTSGDIPISVKPPLGKPCNRTDGKIFFTGITQTDVSGDAIAVAPAAPIIDCKCSSSSNGCSLSCLISVDAWIEVDPETSTDWSRIPKEWGDNYKDLYNVVIAHEMHHIKAYNEWLSTSFQYSEIWEIVYTSKKLCEFAKKTVVNKLNSTWDAMYKAEVEHSGSRWDNYQGWKGYKQ